jgi:nitroimidazol reductase NimA-like FMN-containing flavoprotein (pyridoxamine 5'-phosphate oxidase superfamily)
MANDLPAIARAIIDANEYLVLGTADQTGRPWVSPVYYAHSAYREFFWISRPDARHSQSVEARRDVSIVIFDSTVPIGTGQAVYITASAEELAGDERAEGIEIYSRRSVAHGGRTWTLDDVQSAARHRLYRAIAAEHYVLDEQDQRVRVSLS